VNKKVKTIGDNKGRVKKLAKIPASYESLLQKKVMIEQDRKVFLAVCDGLSDAYGKELEVIWNGQQKCEGPHGVFYTLLHNVTMWKVLVESTLGKSLESLKMSTILRKDKHTPHKKLALMAHHLDK